MQKKADQLNILVLTSTYPRWENDHEPGFVHELSKRLAKHHRVTVLSPHAPGASSFQHLDGVDVYRFRYAPQKLQTLVNEGGIVNNLKRHPWKWLLVPFFFLGLCISTFRMIKRYKPDVVHAHWLVPQGCVLALLRGIGVSIPPYVVTSHGADLFALKAKPFEWVKRTVAEHAEKVTVVSRIMVDELVRLGIDEHKIIVQSMGVDLAGRFKPDKTQIEGDELSILFVGRLVEKKGVEYLIDSIPEIIQKFPSVKVNIIGHGPLLKELKSKAEMLRIADYIDFKGSKSQEEIAKHANAASVFVAPFIEAVDGDQEGLGLVVVEALGVGCPVVVTDIPAARDIIDASGGVCVVRQRSSSELAEAVIRVLGDPEGFRKSALSSRHNLVSKFDWESVAASYSAILLENSRRSASALDLT